VVAVVVVLAFVRQAQLLHLNKELVVLVAVVQAVVQL
jgi:hypothetical protein